MNEFKAWILAAAAAACAFVFLAERVHATRLGYELGSAHAELRDRRNRVAYLKLELDRLHAPERLAGQARSRLGMRPPTPESLVVLGNGVARPVGENRFPQKEKGFALSRLIE